MFRFCLLRQGISFVTLELLWERRREKFWRMIFQTEWDNQERQEHKT